ncbi:MAG: c-type cytochrome [Tardiphaga sp.]
MTALSARYREIACVAITLGLITQVAFAALPAHGDAKRGEVLYRNCEGCHSIDRNGVGPMHRGVFGRAAGTVKGYHYSPALKNAKITWTEETLDRWLANPQSLVPGSSMFYQVADPRDRADLIAFLREQAQ